jgi:hypothetical protein
MGMMAEPSKREAMSDLIKQRLTAFAEQLKADKLAIIGKGATWFNLPSDWDGSDCDCWSITLICSEDKWAGGNFPKAEDPSLDTPGVKVRS